MSKIIPAKYHFAFVERLVGQQNLLRQHSCEHFEMKLLKLSSALNHKKISKLVVHCAHLVLGVIQMSVENFLGHGQRPPQDVFDDVDVFLNFSVGKKMSFVEMAHRHLKDEDGKHFKTICDPFGTKHNRSMKTRIRTSTIGCIR